MAFGMEYPFELEQEDETSESDIDSPVPSEARTRQLCQILLHAKTLSERERLNVLTELILGTKCTACLQEWVNNLTPGCKEGLGQG